MPRIPVPDWIRALPSHGWGVHYVYIIRRAPDERPLYIGRSNSPRYRIETHWREWLSDATGGEVPSIGLVRVHEESNSWAKHIASLVERTLIVELDPIMNTQRPPSLEFLAHGYSQRVREIIATVPGR